MKPIALTDDRNGSFVANMGGKRTLWFNFCAARSNQTWLLKNRRVWPSLHFNAERVQSWPKAGDFKLQYFRTIAPAKFVVAVGNVFYPSARPRP